MTGSVTLIGGPPGIGKSTLLIQIAQMLSEEGRATEGAEGEESGRAKNIVMVSGEESTDQIRHRAERIGFANNPHLYVLNETNVHSIMEQVTPNIDSTCAIIVDSIQTMHLDEVGGQTGSVRQVRECALEFLRLAKAHGVVVFLVGEFPSTHLLSSSPFLLDNALLPSVLLLHLPISLLHSFLYLLRSFLRSCD